MKNSTTRPARNAGLMEQLINESAQKTRTEEAKQRGERTIERYGPDNDVESRSAYGREGNESEIGL